MSIQTQMKTKLESLGIPFKQIDCYGSQIVVTSGGRKTAEKWASVLSQFATVRGIVDTYDDAKVNKNTTLRPSKVRVHRTFARIY